MMKTFVLMAAALALMSSSAVFAQTAQERAACQGDFKKLCPGVMPGGGRVLDCLAKHKEKVSEACQKVLAAHGK